VSTPLAQWHGLEDVSRRTCRRRQHKQTLSARLQRKRYPLRRCPHTQQEERERARARLLGPVALLCSPALVRPQETLQQAREVYFFCDTMAQKIRPCKQGRVKRAYDLKAGEWHDTNPRSARTAPRKQSGPRRAQWHETLSPCSSLSP
jgi:hypothetical protein